MQSLDHAAGTALSAQDSNQKQAAASPHKDSEGKELQHKDAYNDDVICIAQICPTNTATDGTIPKSVLMSLHQSFREALRETDHVFELAQDRFCFQLTQLRGTNHAKLAAAKFQRITESVTDHKFELHAGFAFASIVGSSDRETLHIWAEIACNEAKRRTEVSLVANADLIQAHTQNLKLGEELDQAILQHDLLLFYQPQIDADGCVAAFESLLRWQREKLVSPGEFLPQLQQQELYRLTQYTARKVIRDLAELAWLPALSLNIDPLVLDSVMLKLIFDELSLWQVEPHRLTIEITEAGLIHNYDATIALLARAQAAGIAVAIDDFGTGYSSLAHFKHLPIDELKIDMVFVRDLAQDEHNQYLCKMMIDLAHRFDHHVVAEGVEDEWTANWLIEQGCDLLQGYFYSPPLPKDCLADLLDLEDEAATG